MIPGDALDVLECDESIWMSFWWWIFVFCEVSDVNWIGIYWEGKVRLSCMLFLSKLGGFNKWVWEIKI